jgi:hypothetical protein
VENRKRKKKEVEKKITGMWRLKKRKSEKDEEKRR